jgi:hypothetical protein
MSGTSCPPPASTFVLRFWREWSAAGSRWRGRIEHVQSGESAVSLDLQGILDFIERCGVMAEEMTRQELRVKRQAPDANRDGMGEAGDEAQAKGNG